MAISKIKLPDNSVQELRDSRMGNAKIFYGTCDTAAATVAKVVTCPDFTAEDLVRGALIFVTFDNTNSGAPANLTLNVNETGAKPLKKQYITSGSSNLTSAAELNAGSTYLFQYNGTNWICMSLDYNSTYGLYNLPESSGYNYYVVDSVVYRYQLLFQRDANKLTPLNNNSNVTTATKTMLTNVTFDPFGKIYYYNTTTTIAANGNINGGSLLYHAVVDFRYSVNQTTITAYKDVYLQVIPQSDGMVKIASATPLVQELPTTNDGYWYIFLGRAYNTTNLTLYSDHPVYRHNGTEIVEVPNPKLAANFVSTSEYDSDQEVLANSINDLNDRIDAKVSNVQSDWNATSGLAEILNKPTIPDAVTESTVSGWGFTKNSGTVTGSGLTNNAIVLGSGTTGIKTSSKTIVTTLGTNDTTVPTSKAVKDAIDALPEPMQFKGTVGTGGTITTLPAAAAGNTGYTYKVITNGTYQSIAAKAGDTFISNGSSWTLIPSGDEPSGTVTNIATGTGLIGGPITTTGTISIDTDVVAQISDIPTQATVSGWGFTKNTGTLTGVKFNGTSASVSGGVASITATIPAAPGTLITNATAAQTASTGEAMSGSITLHKIAKTGTYSDLIGKPTIPAAPGTLNTNNTTAQTVSASEALSGTISLHKVAKTGTYSDLIGTPTIPTESTVSGWGFTKNSGTVTSVKVGTTSYNPTSGVVSLPAYPSVPTAMTATEANAGTATTARTITAAVLAGAIDNKITCMTQNEVDATVNTIFS